MTPADSPRRVHVLTALLLVGTFAAGVVTGAGILRSFAPPAPPAPAAAPPPLAAIGLPRELRLTPAQDAKAREIGERYRPALEAIAAEVRPRVRSVQDRMEGELVALLSPEQKQQLAAIVERRRHPPRPDAPGGGDRGAPRDEGREEGGRRPPPAEAVEACAHLDLDRLCRFVHDGREHEGICRRPPGGEGPLSCAPDRGAADPPPNDGVPPPVPRDDRPRATPPSPARPERP